MIVADRQFGGVGRKLFQKALLSPVVGIRIPLVNILVLGYSFERNLGWSVLAARLFGLYSYLVGPVLFIVGRSAVEWELFLDVSHSAQGE